MSPDSISPEFERYPLGRFSPPASFDSLMIREWRQHLADLPMRLREAVRGLTNEQLDTPYRTDGWTVRQTVHHLADSHANAYIRIRLALTEDGPVIKPYSETRWAELPDARTMPVAVSIELLSGLHARWVVLLDQLTPDDWRRTFIHPEHTRPMTLWHMTALYAWHCRHHVAHISNLRNRNGWRI